MSDINKEKELEEKIKKLEEKLEKVGEKKEKKGMSFGWVVNLLGWIILIGLLWLLWLNLKPILWKTNNLLNVSTSAVKKIDRGASTSNEILDTVNHPIDSASKMMGF